MWKKKYFLMGATLLIASGNEAFAGIGSMVDSIKGQISGVFSQIKNSDTGQKIINSNAGKAAGVLGSTIGNIVATQAGEAAWVAMVEHSGLMNRAAASCAEFRNALITEINRISALIAKIDQEPVQIESSLITKNMELANIDTEMAAISNEMSTITDQALMTERLSRKSALNTQRNQLVNAINQLTNQQTLINQQRDLIIRQRAVYIEAMQLYNMALQLVQQTLEANIAAITNYWNQQNTTGSANSTIATSLKNLCANLPTYTTQVDVTVTKANAKAAEAESMVAPQVDQIQVNAYGTTGSLNNSLALANFKQSLTNFENEMKALQTSLENLMSSSRVQATPGIQTTSTIAPATTQTGVQ
ncbi:MAG: hypothetical protein LBT63_02040 [Holosporaceae bacterium]|jgi:tetratricopeptide (TPR) repeat protein|nr:hypothetical protein [Holosporaceae bacterium]